MGKYDFLGTGFYFPIAPDGATGRIKEVSGEEDIIQAIGLIISTRKGERLMRPDFGCDIYNYVFELTDYTNLRMMEKMVRDSLLIWEPRIRDIEVTASYSQYDQDVVELNIDYVVRSTNNPFNLVYPFYLSEGIIL